VVGRFIAQDPIGFRGGDANLYGYVSNAPSDLVDATGFHQAGGIPGIPVPSLMEAQQQGIRINGVLYTQQQLLAMISENFNDFYDAVKDWAALGVEQQRTSLDEWEKLNREKMTVEITLGALKVASQVTLLEKTWQNFKQRVVAGMQKLIKDNKILREEAEIQQLAQNAWENYVQQKEVAQAAQQNAKYMAILKVQRAAQGAPQSK
jgi:uncharacterized protein RhaS with RHS repeats